MKSIVLCGVQLFVHAPASVNCVSMDEWSDPIYSVVQLFIYFISDEIC